MKKSSARNDLAQSDADIAAAPFIACGIIYGLAGLLPLIVPLVTGYNDATIIQLCVGVALSGIALALLGGAIMKRWKYALILAIPICLIGILQFPIGTLIFGWAAYSLWKQKSHFFPFKTKKTEQGAAPNPCPTGRSDEV